MSVGVVNKQTGDRIPTAGMPAIDNALSATSTNPVQNAIITAALANKQDKTDNSLQTTDKTVVGAINEHEGDISSLRSGLTKQAVTLTVDSGITVVINKSYIENKRLYINAQVQLDTAYTGNNTRLVLATVPGIKVNATQAINIVGVSNLGTYNDSILCGIAVKDGNDSKCIVDNIIGASSAIFMFISGIVDIA